MKRKILVIGSRDHNRAECVDWQQPFPNIEEYDSVIINLQSLTQEVYDKTQMKIRRMNEPITTVFNTDREVFCIMNKLILPSPPPRRPGEPRFKAIRLGYVSTNYDWLPMTIEVNSQKKGTSINVHDLRFATYFEFVERWNLTISVGTKSGLGGLIESACFRINPIAMNKSKKTIAGSLKAINFLTGEALQGYGFIHLLPPPTRCNAHQAIEIILDMICGEEVEKAPP